MTSPASSAVRLAASLILCAPSAPAAATAGATGDFRVLMLLRNATGSAFRSKHVFPGGVAEKVDHEMAAARSQLTEAS
ncbi:hypothetical protein HK405_000066, partial [Cladochytrium tenue]